MLVIPLQPVYAQTLTAVLGGQTCLITIRQRTTGMFMDLTVNGAVLFTTEIIRPMTLLVRQPSFNFIGDLVMVDTQGDDDPEWSGLGTRWILMYYSPDDLPAPFK